MDILEEDEIRARLADECEGMPQHIARFMAQDRIIHRIRRDGGSFRSLARAFVHHELPKVAAELPGTEKLLRYAGFGGGLNLKITAAMLQMWDQDAWLPMPQNIDPWSAFYSIEEATSLSRAGLLGPHMPTTLRKMSPYVERLGSGLLKRPADMPSTPHSWVALAARGGHPHAGQPAPKKYDPRALLRLLPPYAFDKRRLAQRSTGGVSPA